MVKQWNSTLSMLISGSSVVVVAVVWSQSHRCNNTQLWVTAQQGNMYHDQLEHHCCTVDTSVSGIMSGSDHQGQQCIQSIISFTTSHTFNKKKNVVESSDHCTLITNLAGIVRMQFQRSYGFISISQQRPGPGKICSKNGSGSPGTGHRNTEEKTSKVGEHIFLNQKKLNLGFECVKYVAVALILSCFKSFYDENIPSMHLSTISVLTMKLQRGERTKDLQKHTSQPMWHQRITKKIKRKIHHRRRKMSLMEISGSWQDGATARIQDKIWARLRVNSSLASSTKCKLNCDKLM